VEDVGESGGGGGPVAHRVTRDVHRRRATLGPSLRTFVGSVPKPSWSGVAFLLCGSAARPSPALVPVVEEKAPRKSAAD